MRTFLINFIFYRIDGLIASATIQITDQQFPNRAIIMDNIRNAINEQNIAINGDPLWTGITELNTADERSFNRP